MNMKRTAIAAMCCLAMAAMLSSCSGKKGNEENVNDAIEEEVIDINSPSVAEQVAQLPEEAVFDIVTNLGTISVKLYNDTPKHRENFAKLAFSGFYDNILFHRVINGFMIQAGDPYTKDDTKVAAYGTGGPGYQIPAEFVPEHKHIKGALAAARKGDSANPLKESSGSQFYLVQDEAACAQLDGQYTVFGETVEGIDVIDKIAAVETGARDLPVNKVIIKSVTLNEKLSK